MNFWVKCLTSMLVYMLLTFTMSDLCMAAPQQEKENTDGIEKALMKDMELEEVEEAVKELLEEDISFQGLMKKFLSGGSVLDKDWKERIKTLMVEGLGVSRQSGIYILCLVLASALFSNLALVFENRQIAEVSFYVVYLMLFAMLLHLFQGFSQQLESILNGILSFMKVLLPAYFLAISAASGLTTATMFYQMMVWILYLAQAVILQFLLPATGIYLLLALINFLTKEEFLSKLTELLKDGILWVQKGMFGVIVGLQLIQRLVSPAIDQLKRTMIGRTAGAIPGIGNLFTGATQVVLGSAVLVKNCLGAAAIVIMILAALAPLIKLGVNALFYQFLAAVIQPVTDKRMVGCIHTMGECIALLLRLLFTVEILFLITIAILAGSTN